MKQCSATVYCRRWANIISEYQCSMSVFFNVEITVQQYDRKWRLLQWVTLKYCGFVAMVSLLVCFWCVDIARTILHKFALLLS